MPKRWRVVRIPEELARAIDRYRERQPVAPSFQRTFEHMLENGLAAAAANQVLTGGTDDAPGKGT